MEECSSKPMLTALMLMSRPQDDFPAHEAAKLVINFVLPLKKAAEKNDDFALQAYEVERLDPAYMADLACLRHLDLVTSQVAKQVVETLWKEWSGRDVLQILIQDGLVDFCTSGNARDIASLVDAAVAEQQGAVADYKGGKQAAFGRLMGAAMKKVGKGADPQEVKATLMRILSE